MKVDVDLVLKDGTTERRTVEVKAKKITPAFLDRVDKAVEKAFGDDDRWERWNLVEIHEDVLTDVEELE